MNFPVFQLDKSITEMTASDKSVLYVLDGHFLKSEQFFCRNKEKKGRRRGLEGNFRVRSLKAWGYDYCQKPEIQEK